MTALKKAYGMLFKFLKRMNDDQVGAFAAQASFFLILSIFPFIMLILNIIRFTPVTKSILLEVTVDIFPNALDPLIITIIEEMYSMSSGTIISITAILAVWSASKGILSLIRGFNFIYHTKEKRNYFHLRLIASLYTVVFIIGVIASLTFLVFGNSLMKHIYSTSPAAYSVISTLTSLKFIYMPVLLTLFFLMIYRLVPNERYRFVNLLPGALFSALGWIIFSQAFSFYIDNFAGMSYMYGSLTTVVMLMLWLYFCMFIIFLGSEINLFFKTMLDNFVEKRA